MKKKIIFSMSCIALLSILLSMVLPASFRTTIRWKS